MIPAHKFVLAISSPVFYAMFYGQLAEKKDSIEISDCEYEGLLELLRFMYSDETNLTPGNVMQLMYLAKKYTVLPSLADKCFFYLQENLHASNAFHVLPAAQKYEEKDLLDHCWKVIEKETDEAVKSDGFVTVERSVLEELAEKDSLNIKEVELFKAVNCWAGNECEKQGLVAEGSVKRRILGERIVKGIRFPVMEQKEFAGVVLDCGILTQKECFDMMKYFNSVLNCPVGFPEAKRFSFPVQRLSRFSSVAFNHGWPYSPRQNCIRFSVDKPIRLHALRLFGSDNGKYAVAISLYNGKEGICIETKKGKYFSKNIQSEMGNYHGFDVILESPVVLEAHIRYILSAKLTGPPSWYGESGLSHIEHAGVKFVFKSHSAPTTVENGQFAEFSFTVV